MLNFDLSDTRAGEELIDMGRVEGRLEGRQELCRKWGRILIIKEYLNNKFLISERVNFIHFEPGLR
jgi:hypothetical protein